MNLFLFDYRSSTHLTTGQTPSFLMYKRKIRTRFDLMRRSVVSNVEGQQFRQKMNKNALRQCEFFPGERVYVKDYRKKSKNRCEAKVVKKLSPVSYSVEIEKGRIVKRHANQIIKTRLRHNHDVVSKGVIRSAGVKEYVNISENDVTINDKVVNRNVRKKVDTNDVVRRSARLKNKCVPK